MPGGYCPEHQPKEKRSEAAAEWHALYRLPVWKDRLRPEQLAREPYCRECWERKRERVWATDVDHVRPHRGDLRLFLDPGNLQSLCHACHSAKTAKEINQRKRG